MPLIPQHDDDISAADCASFRPRRRPTPLPPLANARNYAGHATIALVQDVEVELLVSERPSVVFVERLGGKFIDEGTLLHLPNDWPESSWQRTKLAEKTVRIALAGPCAELVLENIECRLELIMKSENDWQVIWETSKLLWQDEENRLSYLIKEVGRMDTFLRLDQFRTAIYKISEAILTHKRLTGKQVKEIYDRATESQLDVPATRRRRKDYPDRADAMPCNWCD